MPPILHQHYGAAEGPLGFPLLDKQAFALEAILKALPKDETYSYRKTLVEPAAIDLLPGDRSDVSWISTENPDRMHEVVRARGMNDGQYRLNPLVTLNHAYWAPPAGKSLWRRVVKESDLKGVKAKTFYLPRPNQWPEKEWVPDLAFALVQADLLRGKSIGFLPTKVHVPELKEIDQNGWQKVALVIDEWILLEYACVYLPAQQNAVVEAVGKALPQAPAALLSALGIIQTDDGVTGRLGDRVKDAGVLSSHPVTPSPGHPVRNAPDIPFTTLDTLEALLQRHLDALDLPSRAEKMLQARLDHWRGRV
jgi:hypothetical protein